MELQDDSRTDGCDRLSIRLLGDFRVSSTTQVVREEDFRLRNAARLVKLLALAQDHVLHREEIVDWLWPDLPMEAAANNLRYTLHVARRVLRPLVSRPAEILTLAGQQIQLGPTGLVETDVEQFEQAVALAQRTPDLDRWQAAVQRYGGELLPADRYEDWAALRRESLREMFLQALIALSGMSSQSGGDTRAIEALERAVALDPAREEAHVGLMRLYALRGQRQLALRQYGRMRDALLAELDVEPEMVSQALYQAILLGHYPPGSNTAAPVNVEVETVPDTRHNLPELRDSFIGRTREIPEISGLLQATRFLTLIGSGGVGKTRLALEVARKRSSHAREDIWFIDLAAVTDGRNLVSTIANTLGLEEAAGVDPLDQVINYLGTSSSLLLIDNCEHLVEPVASTARALLLACPAIRVLATSREPLRVTGEVTYRVPSLALPRSAILNPDELSEQAESVQLFVNRAARLEREFRLTGNNASLVAQICLALDGIPLAIELAAARAGAFRLDDMLASLGNALHLQEHRNRSAPARHQTLQNALDWSYDLLSDAERRFFRSVAVFAGGWTLEAAEAVGAPNNGVSSGAIDLLASLVDRSLVVLDAGRLGLRYRMLEPVRQYAATRLRAADEEANTRTRHAGYILTFVTNGEPGLRGPTQGEWISRYEAERANLRAALDWSIETNPDTALRIAAGAGRFWYIRSHGVEGRGMLRATLDAAPDGDQATRARVLSHAGVLADEAGNHTEATQYLEAALQIFRDLDHTHGMATALNSLGAVARSQGDSVRAIQLFEKSLKVREQLGDEAAVNLVKSNLAAVVMDMGEIDRAEKLLEETIRYDRTTGNEWSEAISLAYLGRIAWERGEYVTACDHLLRSCALADRTGDQGAVGDAIEMIAGALGAMGHTSAAARLWGAAESMRTRISLPTPDPDLPFYNRMLATVRKGANSQAFDEAWATGRQLTMEDAVLLAQREVQLLRERPRKQPDVLTSREAEIAALIGQGQTNAQIAASLNIAVRTVDTHVSRILRKLGVTSRAEILARQQPNENVSSP